MRLFIAINLNKELKDGLCHTMQRLKEHTLQGIFTLRENLHLTLVFIGETTKASSIRQAMDKVRVKPFSMSIGGLGRFRRDDGDIYWIGVEKNDALFEIYSELYQELTIAGFSLEKGKFKPHLTLARRVVLRDGFDMDFFTKSVPSVTIQADNISLMKSERINGKLTYTEIYKRSLWEDRQG